MSTTWLRRSSVLIGLAVILLLVAACAAPAPTPAPTTAAQPTTAPTRAATTAPTTAATSAATTAATSAATAAATKPSTAATTAPTTSATTAAGAFTPMKVTAPDCNYGTADNPAEFKSIEAVDQYTVRFTLCGPDPAFPAKVAFSAFAIQDRAVLESTGGDSIKLSDKPNGTGPYMVQEWVRGDHITYTANPNYWGDKAKTKTVIFRWSKEAAQRLLELQSGTVDGIDNPAPEDFATVQKDTKVKLYPRPALNVFYIGFNNTMKPFDNEKVRQAIAMAVDRKRIVDNFYPAGSVVAEQFDPPVLKPGYTDGFKWYDYDVKAAKQLLADAGFPNGFDMQLSYRDVVRGYLPLPGKVAQDIQAQLKDIGINVTLNVMESGAFIDAANAGRLPFFLLGWGADYPDSTNFFDYHFANSNNKEFGTLFSDLVTEIKAGGAVADAKQRQTRYDKVNQLIKQHVPMIPVAHGGSATVFKSTVQGAHSSPLSNELFNVMSTGGDRLVWMQNAEPNSLWCADETDGETLRACEQVYESLLGYKIGGTETVPSLAELPKPNNDLSEWTFTLKKGVKFHNGHELNANDVVASYNAQWDAKAPTHKGRTGDFAYFGSSFGAMLNAKK